MDTRSFVEEYVENVKGQYEGSYAAATGSLMSALSLAMIYLKDNNEKDYDMVMKSMRNIMK